MKPIDIERELLESKCFGSTIALKAVNGGVVNSSYRLETPSESFYVKAFAYNYIVPIDRHAQFLQQQQLAELGRAPIPLYLSNKHEFQVERWIEHQSLACLRMSREQKVYTLAKTLSKLHHLPLIAQPLNLNDTWDAYIRHIDLNLHPELHDCLHQCQTLLSQSLFIDKVMCHNDLSFQHIADDGDGVIFDWEYSATGNPFFDLACCSIVNKLSNNEESMLIELYSDSKNIELKAAKREYQLQRSLSCFTNRLWYLALS